MTPPDWVQAIAARCAAATPGPWEYDCLAERVFAPNKKRICNVDEAEMSDHDGEWIAHARTDVPALLALVEDMVSALTRITGVDLGPIDGHTADDCEVRCAYHGAAAALAKYQQGPGATTGGGDG